MRGLIFVGLMLASMTASAVNWVEVASSTDGMTVVLVDADTLRRTGDIVKGWTLSKYTKEKSLSSSPHKKFLSMKGLHKWDCAERTVTNLDSIYYSGIDFGDVVHSFDTPKKEEAIEENLTPGSVGEGVLEEVCAGTAPPKKKKK